MCVCVCLRTLGLKDNDIVTPFSYLLTRVGGGREGEAGYRELKR